MYFCVLLRISVAPEPEYKPHYVRWQSVPVIWQKEKGKISCLHFGARSNYRVGSAKERMS